LISLVCLLNILISRRARMMITETVEGKDLKIVESCDDARITLTLT
jgi:hypothetical protein